LSTGGNSKRYGIEDDEDGDGGDDDDDGAVIAIASKLELLGVPTSCRNAKRVEPACLSVEGGTW